MTDPLIPPWEMCKVCGGDHWTRDHPTAPAMWVDTPLEAFLLRLAGPDNIISGEALAAEVRRLLAAESGLDTSGPDLVFSTSPAPEGIDTDCMFLASDNRISVHISRRAINAQAARRAG